MIGASVEGGAFGVSASAPAESASGRSKFSPLTAFVYIPVRVYAANIRGEYFALL